MPTYFLDTSALVKRHVAEIGHAWVRSLCDPRIGNTLVVSELALVEVTAALVRMARETPRRFGIARGDRFIADFEARFLRQYIVMQLGRPVLTRAASLSRTHPLRAYDAVQLASALARRDDDLVAGRTAPVFVCADAVLLGVAVVEGLDVENPNAHP
jgi:predicted nucleic acid-binding protein